jgi:lipoprotein-releasing system permease protein
MRYELFISLRYLKAKRKQAFIKWISAVSIGGVAVGVAALIIVLAVMTGFKDDIRDKILNIMPHILIQKVGVNLPQSDFQEMRARLQDIPQLKDVAPFVSGQVMLSAAGNVTGVKLQGIDPDDPVATANLSKNLFEGAVDLLKQTFPSKELAGPEREGIIIGWELAHSLNIFTGDELTMILPSGRMLPTGPVPKLKKFHVAGIFRAGFYEYDAGLAYISLTSAQRFFSMGQSFSGLEVRLVNLDQAPAVAKALKARLGVAYQVQDWSEMNKSLFSAINLEKLAMSLILALIVLVAAFNIISTLVMMVVEKHSDIATLKSMGATSRSIMRIFMFEGSVIGLIGTTIGALVAVPTCWILDAKELIPLDGGAYYLNHLPFTVTFTDVALVIVASLGICFLSTLYPARQASRLDPVAVFRSL